MTVVWLDETSRYLFYNSARGGVSVEKTTAADAEYAEEYAKLNRRLLETCKRELPRYLELKRIN
jgi:hypothetical protein